MFRRFLLPIAIALSVTATSAVAQRRARTPAIQPAPAAAAPCLQFYLDRRRPAPATTSPASERIICHSFYALSYSTARHDPVWTSYLMTRAMARGADGFGRLNRKFGPQDGLSASEQGDHDDYTNSGFARGHMTPADDAPTPPMQADTFVVTNIVPQNSPFNSGLWAQLEGAIHRLAATEGEVYVVTGPLFETAVHAPVNGIAVPSSLFKAIYVPSRGFALAFISTNENPTRCRIVAIAEVQRRAGLDPFPSLPAAAKASLPATPPRWGAFPARCTTGP